MLYGLPCLGTPAKMEVDRSAGIRSKLYLRRRTTNIAELLRNKASAYLWSSLLYSFWYEVRRRAEEDCTYANILLVEYDPVCGTCSRRPLWTVRSGELKYLCLVAGDAFFFIEGCALFYDCVAIRGCVHAKRR